jgi:hemerythrin superfamily protein
MMDIFNLLKEDHDKVKNLFQKLEKTEETSECDELFGQLEQELTVHSRLEEEHFYPALEHDPQTKDLISEALKEHQQVDQVLEDLMDMLPDDEDWDEILKELNRLVEHHVAEEENTIFPKVQQVLGEEKAKELAETSSVKRNRCKEITNRYNVGKTL